MFLLIGVNMLLIFQLLGKGQPDSGRLGPVSAVPRVDPAMVPLMTGEEPIDQIFVKAGCPVCHTIPGIVGAEGKVGPKLTLNDTGPSRLTDPAYRGRAKTVKEYVIESVLEPEVYVVPGFPDRTMPTWYGRKLNAMALDKLAAYLTALSDAPAQIREPR